jgi:uncharacterized protein with HEPN domain
MAPADSSVVTHVRGVGILAFRATILAALPQDATERLLAELGPEARQLMQRPPQAEEWIPFGRLAEIREVFQSLFGMRLEKVRGMTLANLIFSHPQFQKLRDCKDIAPFLEAFPQIWQAFHKGGRVQATRRGPDRARIEILARFPYPEYIQNVVPAAFQESLSLIGLAQGQVIHTALDSPRDHHCFDLSWKA